MSKFLYNNFKTYIFIKYLNQLYLIKNTNIYYFIFVNLLILYNIL